MKKAILLTSILFAVIFTLSQNSFAQGPCLLGVGNCQQQPQPQPPADGGKRRVHVTDYRAAHIYQAKQNNQKYLLTLGKPYYENGLLCEDRAWVGGATFAGDTNQVIVEVGPAKKVCYNPSQPVWSSEQVNEFEKTVDTFTTSYYQWHKYAENCAVYINQNRNNPQAVAYGQSELKKAQYSMTYYQNSITNYRNVINQVAP